jgi:hypothetical protein
MPLRFACPVGWRARGGAGADRSAQWAGRNSSYASSRPSRSCVGPEARGRAEADVLPDYSPSSIQEIGLLDR